MKLEEYASQAGSLFVLPDSVTRLKECLDDGASSIDIIGSVISTDPALTTQLLKIANSALYSFPGTIDSIAKALQVIGTRSAYDLSLAYGVSHAFKNVDGKIIDLDKFWEQSVSCGLLAKYLAEHRGIRNSERLFVTGLLHNVGELVVVSITPDVAEKCFAFSQTETPASLQQKVLGFKYSTLSALLIKKWGIPESIWQSIRTINHDASKAFDEEGQILQLAYSLALDNINPEIYPAYSNVNPELLVKLKLERDDLEDALDITNMQCLSILSMFNPTAFMIY